MAQKRTLNQTKVIAETTLLLADSNGWENLTIKEIARKTKMGPDALRKIFPSIWDILAHILTGIEEETSLLVRNHLGGSWRDNLMEIMMTRFDLAERHRNAFASLPKALRKNPDAALQMAPRFYQTMDNMLELAKFPETPFRPLAIAGLGTIYLAAVNTWTKDDTRDKSKTMSTIDKNLGRFESVVAYATNDSDH